MVFAPIPFQPEAILPSPEPAAPAADQAEPTETAPAPEYGSHHIRVLKVDGLPSTRPKSARKEFDTQKLSWNPYKHCLAFVSGKNQVTVQDFEDSDAKEPCSLTSDHQTNVKAIGWRPNSGKMIAVACKWEAGRVMSLVGIISWQCSVMKSGITSSSSSAFSRGSGCQWILVVVLRGTSAELVSALCWKPDGRYFASASCNSPSFTIWDVSQVMEHFTSGRRTHGLQNPGLRLTDMCLEQIGIQKVVCYPFRTPRHLAQFTSQFSSKPRDAHLLPFELPEISSLIVSQGLEKLAWDASGERLALSFKDGNEMCRGLIAVYDVRRSPLVSLSLVGFIR